MIFNIDHDRDLYAALNKYPDGITFQALFTSTSLFLEERELSIFLSKKIPNGDVYKQDRLYFLAEKHRTVKDVVTEEIRSLLQKGNVIPAVSESVEQKREPKVIRTEYFKKTVVPPLEVKAPNPQIAEKRDVVKDEKPGPINGKPSGRFQRTSLCGKYAYIFYRFRLHEPLSNDDLRRLIIHDNFTDSSHYQAFLSLKKNGFIEQVEKGRTPTFRWTGQYAYPFSSIQLTDADCLKYKPEEYYDLMKNTHVHQASEKTPETNQNVIQITTQSSESQTENENTSIVVNTQELVVSSGKEYPVPTSAETCKSDLIAGRTQHDIKKYLDEQIKKLELELHHVKYLKEMLIRGTA